MNEKNHTKDFIKTKTLDELLQIPIFNNAYQKVVKKNMEIQNSTMAKTAMEDAYNFTIVSQLPVKIIEKVDRTIYTLKITKDTIVQNLGEKKLENLVIDIRKDGRIAATIFKFIYTGEKTESLDNSFKIGGDLYIQVEQLDIEGQERATMDCIIFQVLLCDYGLNTGGATHIAGANCGTVYWSDPIYVGDDCPDQGSGGTGGGDSGDSGDSGESGDSGDSGDSSSNSSSGSGSSNSSSTGTIATFINLYTSSYENNNDNNEPNIVDTTIHGSGGSLNTIFVTPNDCVGNDEECIEADDDATEPCKDLKKMKNKQAMNNDIIRLKDNLHLKRETGSSISITPENMDLDLYTITPSIRPQESCQSIRWQKDEFRIGINHTHTTLCQSYKMFSILDLYSLYQLIMNYSAQYYINSNVFFINMIVNGYVYSLKIDPANPGLNGAFNGMTAADIYQMDDNLFKEYLEYGEPDDNNIQNQITKAFLAKANQFGINLYRTPIGENKWEQLKLNPEISGGLQSIPCNN